MAKRKRATPFKDDDFVYFELWSPSFRAFDVYTDGAVYSVPEFKPGIHRLLIDAIREATPSECKKRADQIISVDACQIFFIDCDYYARFRKCLDDEQGMWPNYPYFEKLRKQVGVDFGHVNVIADGSYLLDLTALEWLDPDNATSWKENRPKTDPFEKVARRMNTFICETCFDEELMGNRDTSYQELAKLAKEQGWQIVPPEGPRESWFFENFQVLGPRCARKRRKSSKKKTL